MLEVGSEGGDERTSASRQGGRSKALVHEAEVEVRPLFGFQGDRCRGGQQRCVLVTDSYGVYRPAFLDGHKVSAEEAALSLLQDQLAVSRSVNNTRITMANVRQLVGIEPVPEVDGKAVELERWRELIGSGAELRLSWRPVANFAGEPLHAAGLVELANFGGFAGDEKFLPHLRKIGDWFKGTGKKVMAIFHPSVVTNFINGVKGLVEALSGFFNCLGNLPEDYDMGGITGILGRFVKNRTDALGAMYNVWVVPPLNALEKYTKQETDADVKLEQNVVIGSSKEKTKCVEAYKVGQMHCEADAAERGSRSKGNDGKSVDLDANFNVEVQGRSRVCVTRTDRDAGWNFDLWISCWDTMRSFPVMLGASSESNKKCVKVRAINPACHPDAADGAVSGGGARLDFGANKNKTHDFMVTVDVKEATICAERVNMPAGVVGWELDLNFECHATAFEADFSTIADGTWKGRLIELGWVWLLDLVNMPDMEVGKCVAEHILWPLKQVAYNYAMTGMKYADKQVRAFLKSIIEMLRQSMEGLQFDKFAGIDLKELGKVAAAEANRQCLLQLMEDIPPMGNVTEPNRILQGLNLSLTAKVLNLKLIPGVVNATVRELIRQIGEYVIQKLYAPFIRHVQEIMVTAGNQLFLFLEGICGLIPQIGGFLCNIMSMPLSSALTWIQEPLFVEAMKLGRNLFTGLSGQLANWLSEKTADLIAHLYAKITVASNQVYAWLDAAIEQLPWIGAIVSKQDAHRMLGTIVTGIVTFAQKMFQMVFPELEENLAYCLKIRQNLVGI